MWISTHSATWFPTLVEIEAPTKRVFKSGAVPTHQFTQARNQLAQWRTWFREPANVQKFISEYGIPESYTRFRTMQPHFLLIYGRRSEAEGSEELSKHRASLMPGADEELMSFDRLDADLTLRNAITVRAVGYGRYRAVSLMPTLMMGPVFAERLLHIDGLEEAIAADQRIAPPRRAFLIERMKYWRSWAAGPKDGIVSSGDNE